jgi:hypothetical protein
MQKVKQSKNRPLDPDSEGTITLKNTGNYTPNDTISDPRRI